MIRMKRLSEAYGMKVFVETGEYYGEIEEAQITRTKVQSWKIRATKNSLLSKMIGASKGVIIPHKLVKAIGDIVIVCSEAIPSYTGEEEAK